MTWRWAILLLIYTPPAFAVELREAPIRVTNKATAALECNAQLAHWFSAGLGRAAPGETLRIPLWHEPESGTYVLLNASQDRMPVEALWCGIAGKAYETRATIERGRTAVTCTGDKLVCE